MLKYEKEMIPILNEHYLNNKKYSIVKNEINSGYGIADIVITKNNKKYLNYKFNNIFEVDLLASMQFNKWITLENIIQYSHYSPNYLKYHLLKHFIIAGLVCREKNQYKRIKKFNKTKNSIIAVEAKLYKWKDAFRQALRYKKFADYCYIALMEKSLRNVDEELFCKNDIGIIYINKNKKVKTYIKANKNKDKDNLYTVFVNNLILS